MRLWSVLAVGSLLAAFLLCQGPTNLYGQAQISASIGGLVLDSSGGVVPGAAVTLSESARAFARHFTTQSDGRYVFTLIPSGTYTLNVEKVGFRTHRETGIELTIGVGTTLDVILEVGTLAQNVQVTATAAILDTTNTNIGSEISQKQSVELPLNQRNRSEE